MSLFAVNREFFGCGNGGEPGLEVHSYVYSRLESVVAESRVRGEPQA